MRLQKFLKLLIDSLKTIYEPTKNNKKNYLYQPIEIVYRSMQLGNASLTNAFAAERIHQLEESNCLVPKEFNIQHYGIGSAQYS
ncbi:hypothetical protein Pst134EA_030239 [Puccinia striiformis f. sp. tritici]|uniref:hypothetical protein n=1 Tax=Puccinia striiformis f. sp. tritici TaxID=168172 RepID=UPI0020081721|nr:hypothetical protein Pst134EA_030239 [Puccinia striiformis f. sp. tritici]KAH9446318.1 hypothetical protein Pst134EA_030239 [Puccinia striiformis f. sp. tritici]